MNDKRQKHRPVLFWAVFFIVVFGLGVGIWQALVHPNTPLPAEWNPMRPLNVNDPVTPLTTWKLDHALTSRDRCLGALETGASAQVLPDFEASDMCHIRPQVNLVSVGKAGLRAIKTRCQTALRMAMWERHGIQPAAQRYLGREVKEIKHFSSYYCREMRTTRGATGRMSSHATADAIDINGFVLTNGQSVMLLEEWNGAPDQAAFLRAVRDSACGWFRVTLGPDYNALHADHFHLQHTGWGLCR